VRQYKLIDVHSHAILPFGGSVPLAKLPPWSVEAALALMDENGIAASVLSIPHAAQHGSAAEASSIARRINETIAEIIVKHPTRFGGLATIPGHLADATLTEIEYALDTLKLDGVATSTNINNVYLGEPCFDPWFEELNRRGATLFIHPWTLSTAASMDLGLNHSVFEFMFDTTRMLANMVLSGAKKRFSNINMISTHGGGTMPFLTERFQQLEVHFGASERATVSAQEIRQILGSFYYDLTAATTPAQLLGLLDLVPASQLLMGVDIPFMPHWTIGAAIDAVERYSGFSRADLEKIVHGNATRLFPGLAARLPQPSLVASSHALPCA
jgi:predicted TIM-barrel fold metal-dependent hydrolase